MKGKNLTLLRTGSVKELQQVISYHIRLLLALKHVFLTISTYGDKLKSIVLEVEGKKNRRLWQDFIIGAVTIAGEYITLSYTQLASGHKFLNHLKFGINKGRI